MDRLEAYEEIRQLAARYGVLVDARDLDGLLELYSSDTPVGSRTGREALRRSFGRRLGAESWFRVTVHFIGNHMIDLDPDDPDRAAGVVYCRAEHEFEDQWVVSTLLYQDEYVREDGRWRFYQRGMKAFYVADVLERPNGPDRVKRQLTEVGLLGRPEAPECWPSWQRFWAERGEQGPG
jgi:hypothetical protein